MPLILLGMLFGAGGGLATYTVVGGAGLAVGGTAIGFGAGGFAVGGALLGGAAGGIAHAIEREYSEKTYRAMIQTLLAKT